MLANNDYNFSVTIFNNKARLPYIQFFKVLHPSYTNIFEIVLLLPLVTFIVTCDVRNALRNTVAQIIKYWCFILLNQIINFFPHDVYPQILKSSNVIPVFEECKVQCPHCRPIYLLYGIDKVLEVLPIIAYIMF